MRGDEVALDTNQAIAVLNAWGDTGTWVQGFSRVFLPVPVVGELRFGALNSARAAANLARVERLVTRRRVLPVTLDVAEVYAAIRLELKHKGRPMPENDVWIAAACTQHGVPLATADAHFTVIGQLAVLLRPPAPGA